MNKKLTGLIIILILILASLIVYFNISIEDKKSQSQQPTAVQT